MIGGDVRSFECDVYDFVGLLRSFWIRVTGNNAWMGTGQEIGREEMEGMEGRLGRLLDIYGENTRRASMGWLDL